MQSPITQPAPGRKASPVLRLSVAAVLVLSLFDGLASLHFRAQFEELNPVLRPLLTAPGLFLGIKMAFVAAGLWILVARCPARVAGALLTLAIAGYLVLDIYWASCL